MSGPNLRNGRKRNKKQNDDDSFRKQLEGASLIAGLIASMSLMETETDAACQTPNVVSCKACLRPCPLQLTTDVPDSGLVGMIVIVWCGLCRSWAVRNYVSCPCEIRSRHLQWHSLCS